MAADQKQKLVKIILREGLATAAGAFIAACQKICQAETINTKAEEVFNHTDATDENTYYVVDAGLLKNHTEIELDKQHSLILFTDETSYTGVYAEPANQRLIAGWSSFFMHGKSDAEIEALLLNYFYPDQTVGLHTLINGGADVYGEKIQNADQTGDLMDRLTRHFRLQYDAVNERMPEIRQACMAMLHESFVQHKVKKTNLPTTDFQIAFDEQRVLLTFRFVQGNINLATIREETLLATRKTWHHLWSVCGTLHLTAFTKIGELEVKAVIPLHQAMAYAPSFLVSTGTKPAQQTDLLRPLLKYRFRLISELDRAKGNSSVSSYGSNASGGGTSGMGNQLNYKLKVERLRKEIETLQRVIKKKNDMLVETQEGIANVQRDAAEKKSQAMLEANQERGKALQAERSAKSSDAKARHYQRKLEEVQAVEAEQNSEEAKQDNASLQHELKQAELKTKQQEAQIKSVTEKYEHARDEADKLRKALEQMQS